MSRKMQEYLALMLVGVIALVLMAVMVLPPVQAADPQTVTGKRLLDVDSGTVRYSTKAWTYPESVDYGVVDLYYSLAISDTTEVVTVTLQHAPQCGTLWEAYSTDSYTKTQAVTAGTVFTRLVNYGGCLGIQFAQSNTAITSPITTTVMAVLKNN